MSRFLFLLWGGLALAGCATPDAAISSESVADSMSAADTLALDALADTLAPAEAARYAFHGRDLEGKDGPLAKMGEDLAHLYFAYRAHRQASQPGLFEPPAGLPDGLPVAEGRVTIDATAHERGARLKADLDALGLAGGAVAGPVISGRLPIEALPEAAQLESLRSMRASRSTTHDGPPVPAPAPPPGTVRATVVMQGCEEGDERYVCTLEVRQVHAYGSATPQAPAGSRQEAAFSARLVRDAGSMGEVLREGRVLDVTLRTRQPQPGGAQTVPWEVTNIQPVEAGE